MGFGLVQCRVLILSQNRDKIYVAFPHFSEAYGKSKNLNNLKPDTFCGCGPFRLRSKEDVDHIANFAMSAHTSISVELERNEYRSGQFAQNICRSLQLRLKALLEVPVR